MKKSKPELTDHEKDSIVLEAVIRATQLAKQGKCYKRTLGMAKKYVTPAMSKALRGTRSR